MNLEGSVIGNRYKIIEKIGNGGMATVYKALDQILNRYVAVKVLRDEFTTDEEFIKRFNAEAQSAARLTHPNIVSVYDVGQEYNIYYIVMELIQGKTLKEIIDEDGSLSWKWSVNIATQIASALEMAHRNHIVHRDIKPHNIMITEEGVAKVTDFGIAKAVSNSTITAFGTTLGSVHYFSPEHARGGYTDAKSDLYSLGVVMYEMVTGKVPFDADTPVSVALKHMQEDPVEPIKVKRDVPFAVNQIIMKALKKDPNERYQNATEIIRDLNMALKRPEGGFIESRNYENSYTQRIPTMDTISQKQEPEENDEDEYYTETFFSAHPKVKVAIIIGAILLALTVVAAVPIITVNVFNSSTKAQDVQIPNVVGLTAEEAKQRVESSKLVYKQEEAYSVDVEAGLVISQNPKYGNYSVKEGTEITVVVSKGIETVEMPKVAGKQFSDVEVELKEIGLQIEKVEEFSDEVESGVVISQEDEPNAKVAKGSTVKIHVSKGIEKVTVPSVEGKSSEEANSTLEELGLKVVTVTEEDNSKENDIVLKQSVEAGSSVEKGSSIKLTINKVEESKTGTVKINVKQAIKTNGIQLEEDTSGGSSSSTTKKYKDPTVIIKVDEEEVYKNTVSQNNENFTKEVSGKKRIAIKVYINGIMIGAKTMDFTASQNPTVVYE